MSGRWLSVKIDSIRAAARYSLVGGPFGSNLTARDYVDEGVPVIRGSNLPDERAFQDDGFVFVTGDKADALISNLAHPGDVVFTQRGTLGQVGLIPDSAQHQRYVISQSQMKLTVNHELVNPWFVYYFFRHPNTVQQIKNQSITSGVPHINLGILKDFEIPLPPIRSQKAIVEILRAYDDLIENNRRRMALLEESARLLYNEWFVRLRFPGHEHMPLVDGVPQGWGRLPLEEALVLQRGFDLPTQERQDGTVPIYGSTGVVGHHHQAKVAAPGVVTGRSGTLGSVHFVAEDYWPLNTALWVKEFKRVTPLFALFLLRAMDLKQYNGGASVPTLDRKSAHRVEILIPSKSLLRSFDDFATEVFKQIKNLESQNQKLRAARDLLLPRLMSGDLIA
jgi:type I restriction enzyme S subunit